VSRRLALFSILLLAFLVTACSGGEGGSSTPDAASPSRPSGSGGDGYLIITKPEGLVEYALEDGSERVIVEPQEQAFILDPAVSPDGGRIAYVQQPPAQIIDGRYDAGSDLWVANRDGGDARAVFVHEIPSQLVRFPKWLDESHILAIVQEPEVRDGIATVIYALQRINIDTGDRETVREDVLDFTVHPDGTRIAFAQLDVSFGETLDAVDLDGADLVTLVGKDQNLAPFNSPRYAPDGSTVAFASADQTLAPVPPPPPGTPPTGRLVTSRPLGRSPGPALDGFPQDIWIVDAGGGPARRAADLKEDVPTLTWSGDGEHIYVLGAAALYDVDLTTGASTAIGPGVFHGQIAWAP
jgi:Tol biopolymer transport system component